MVWQSEGEARLELLDNLKRISEIAHGKILHPGVTKLPEDFHHTTAPLEMNREWDRRSADFRQLANEPLLVAVLAETEDGERRVYYFARRAQVDGVEKYFTHTMSPIGHLATYEPGDEYEHPNGTTLTVISKFVLSPKKDTGKWDSRPTQVYWSGDAPRTLTSLRNKLSTEKAQSGSWEILDDEFGLTDEFARVALRGTGLRDQAILDKVQDEIFRLPLSSQLMISGPPGSGKTTTLIRRMAQKNEPSFLTQDEKAVVERVSENGRLHSESWIMFTPTELLEGYLSEAFNREGVPAPKDRVWTWAKFSHDFGREEARLLRKSNNRSGFTLDEKVQHLSSEVHEEPGEWLLKFEEWLKEEHLKELRDACDNLQIVGQPEVDQISTQIGQLLAEGNAANLLTVFEKLSVFAEDLGLWRKTILAQWRDLMDRRIDRFGRLDAQNIKKLDTLVKEIESVSNAVDSDTQDLDAEDDLEFEEKPTSQSRKDRVFTVVRQSLNARARAMHHHRKPPQRYAEMQRFISDEILGEARIEELGRDLEASSSSSRLLRANSAYFGTMASRYRVFRRLEPSWYEDKEINRDKLDRDEFDALILIKLKAVRELLPRIGTDGQFWSALRPFAEKLRNQVYVDEATDFSEMQLAAMYHIAHPQIRSFFMSGDFDQRLTECGIKDNQALQRAVPGIAIREVEVGYRQSQKLKNFVDLMRRRWLKEETNSIRPKLGQYEGFEPVMFEAEGDLDAQAHWIADRIHEVDEKHERLPSIAILVPRSEDVKPLTVRLEQLLENIPVSAHEEAGNLGRDEEVRVFPIHHVKGLEFEAAFFVGVDQLRRDVPSLFHRYLYVGSTRAATFLGFAANNKMPSEIMDLRDMFIPTWGGG